MGIYDGSLLSPASPRIPHSPDFVTTVPRLLTAMDVAVLATHFEGFGPPLVLLKATAQGQPVVATAIGGILEFARHDETGFLHRHEDDGDLAAQIVSLLRDEDRAIRRGEAGRQLVKTDSATERFGAVDAGALPLPASMTPESTSHGLPKDASRVPRVAVIILNRNSLADTLECLASLRGLTYPSWHPVVADNGSDDKQEAESIWTAFPPVTVLENDRHIGYAGGCNVGVRHALRHGADYVWLPNNHTEVAADCLTQLVERYVAYDEDLDYCLRALGSRYRTLVVPAAKIYHKWARSLGPEESPVKEYSLVRNWYLLWRTHLAGWRRLTYPRCYLAWALRRLLDARRPAAGQGGPCTRWRLERLRWSVGFVGIERQDTRDPSRVSGQRAPWLASVLLNHAPRGRHGRAVLRGGQANASRARKSDEMVAGCA